MFGATILLWQPDMNVNPQYVFHKAFLPGVTTIEPNSPEFHSEVASVVDPAMLSDIQPVLAFSYVLSNASDKFIIVSPHAGL